MVYLGLGQNQISDLSPIANTWYYFYELGNMASNKIIDGYKLDSSGAWIVN